MPPSYPPPYGDQPQGPYGQPAQGPYPPPMPYQPPPGYYPPPPKQTNWWAIVSLIFGLLGGILISVVCGIVGLSKAKQGQGGRGLAIAGLALSGFWVLVAVAAVIFYFVIGKGTVTATD